MSDKNIMFRSHDKQECTKEDMYHRLKQADPGNLWRTDKHMDGHTEMIDILVTREHVGGPSGQLTIFVIRIRHHCFSFLINLWQVVHIYFLIKKGLSAPPGKTERKKKVTKKGSTVHSLTNRSRDLIHKSMFYMTLIANIFSLSLSCVRSITKIFLYLCYCSRHLKISDFHRYPLVKKISLLFQYQTKLGLDQIRVYI